MKRLLLSLFIFSLIQTAFAQTYPLVSLDSVQWISPQDLGSGNDLSYKHGDTIQFEGTVTLNPCYYGLSSGSRIGTFVQTDDPAQPWRALHVLIENGLLAGYPGTLEDLNNDTKFIDNFKIGNKVKASGIVTNFSNMTQIILLPLQSTIQSIGTMPAPMVTTIDQFMQSDGGGGQLLQKTTGEQFESTYIELQNVTVVDVQPSGQRFFWSLQDGAGNKMQVRDLSGWLRNDANDDHCNGFGSGNSATPTTFSPPPLGSNLAWVRGIVLEYNGLYYITPRDTTDIGPIAAAPPVVSNITRNPVVATSTQAVGIEAKIVDPDGVVVATELYYSYGLGNTSFTKTIFTSQGNDKYAGAIPGPSVDSTYVNFWIRAIGDNDDTTDFPSTNSTAMFYLTLDNGINKISHIQNTPSLNGSSIWTNDSIPSMNIQCIVTSSMNTWDLGIVTVQDEEAPWSGIFLFRVPGDGLDQLKRGDSIRIESGKVIENFNLTYITNVKYSLLGQGTMPNPITTVNPDSINMMKFNHAEAHEGVLLRFNNATVVDTNADWVVSSANFGEFNINTDVNATTGLRVDDFSNDLAFNFNVDSLTEGSTLSFIQGPLYYSFSNFKLLPRNLSDIGGFNTNYPKVINSFAFLTLVPQVFLDIDQDTRTITTPNPLPAGTDVTNLVPTIDYSGESLSPASGAAQDFTNPLEYTVVAPVDASKAKYNVIVDVLTGIEELPVDLIKLYPNPAPEKFNIQIDAGNALSIQATLTDITGKIVYSETWEVTSGTNNFTVDLKSADAGIYLLEMNNGEQRTVRKVNVMKF